MFYPDEKLHISPSALDNWFHARGSFVKNYFAGVKTPETASMKAGKQIHALVEAGMLDVQKKFENVETTLIHWADLENEEMKVLGIPDSHEHTPTKGVVRFVDYKSGKAQTWDDVKLAGDLKMKTTAWLVWRNAMTDDGKLPKKVIGYIEYIPTQWNSITREIEPTGGETIVAGEYEYTNKDLEDFTQVIRSTILAVNEAYGEWLESTDEFIDEEDVATYAELIGEKEKIELQLGEIKGRIATQMGLGKKQSYSSPVGSFYFIERRKWEIPEEITKAIASASGRKKKFETENKPIKISQSLAFRARK